MKIKDKDGGGEVRSTLNRWVRVIIRVIIRVVIRVVVVLGRSR